MLVRKYVTNCDSLGRKPYLSRSKGLIEGQTMLTV